MADERSSGGSTLESTFDSRLIDLGIEGEQKSHRWMGWQLRVVVAAALLGCVAFFLLAQWLARTPHVDARWNIAADGHIVLASAADPALRSHVGQTLSSVLPSDGTPIPVDGASTQRSLRWVFRGIERERLRQQQVALSEAYTAGSPRFVFEDGDAAAPELHRRGSASLGGMFWLLGAFALVLYLVAMVVLCSRPNVANLLYAIMATCQVGNLVMIAIESTAELGLPAIVSDIDLPLRMSLDLCTAAAIATSTALHPRRLRGALGIGAVAWGVAAVLCLTQWRYAASTAAWFWSQGGLLTLGLASIALLGWSHRQEPHPFTVLLRRFGLIVVGSLALLTLGVMATDRLPPVQRLVAGAGTTTWCVFFAALLLLVPFLSKSQQIMREFSLLAAISTIATSLDLLFVAVFSLGQFASLTLSLFLSLGVYAGIRQWVLNRLLGSSKLTTERMFEQLYRIAREVEVHPDLAPTLLSNLMRDLFEPLEILLIPRHTRVARVFRAGSSLILPVPELEIVAAESNPPASIVLRYAHRGRQLFTAEDARLADRIAEQLRRAVAFDKAVEQGRSEERARIAQDLHDDIGARLLTLMYKAASPEIEEYVRHTLKDLKTLTRGLAASHHPLSHAAAEWKADLSQRLTAAEIELHWDARFSHDLVLTVVQWSALTRILRELVSNTISHSGARKVNVSMRLSAGGDFKLTVADDGHGQHPSTWSHGLGLSGVRKRVKQLGGEVNWRQASPSGIICSVSLARLATIS